VSLDAAFQRDDGTRDEPGRDSSWDDWIPASRTFNYCCDDPLIDWLDRYGRAHGFVPDDERPGYDARTDFRAFIIDRAQAFERRVLDDLARRHELVCIRTEPAHVRDRAAVEATWDAMARGVECIAQGVLWNPETRTYGAPDLLVRADVLHRLFPDDLSVADAERQATDLPLGALHYRVVDVKFSTLELLRDGDAGAEHLKYMVQVWLYNEALGRMQGFTPPAAFLLGRRWRQGDEHPGSAAFERLARVDRARTLKSGGSVADLAITACNWLRRLRAHGDRWQALPVPSVDELWPNARHTEDHPWHQAKREIAHALEDLTLLPRITPVRRAQGLVAGVRCWSDGRCSAALLGITGEKHPALVDAVIAANQSPADGPLVFPDRVTANEPLWREPVVPEFYVDFETVSDLDDDFSAFPKAGGQPLIFMIGCGHFAGPPDRRCWTFSAFTVRSLSLPEERRIIEEWLAHMAGVCEAAGTTLDRARLFHWSPAETSTLTSAYNAAEIRQGRPGWPVLPWCDLLNRVVKEEPVTVRGAFGFGLKAIAKAMQQHDSAP
jgi:hypothetical protein